MFLFDSVVGWDLPPLILSQKVGAKVQRHPYQNKQLLLCKEGSILARERVILLVDDLFPSMPHEYSSLEKWQTFWQELDLQLLPSIRDTKR